MTKISDTNILEEEKFVLFWGFRGLVHGQPTSLLEPAVMPSFMAEGYGRGKLHESQKAEKRMRGSRDNIHIISKAYPQSPTSSIHSLLTFSLFKLLTH